MKNKFKLGQILCGKSNKKNNLLQRDYFVVIQEESIDKYLVIQPINSNPQYISGTSINPSHPYEDLEVTDLKASSLLHKNITIMDYYYEEILISEAIGFEGNDRLVEFTSLNDDLIGNVIYEIKSPNNLLLSGQLFFKFHHKEKFIKPPYQS